ncbi:hypothetical protein KFE25_010292 [Diacronema lutheri]|uniref:Uncharacterized protein n=1 Tax=Diacronema lutheri TaxID=2081491 RepID=A0A8J5XJF6_DIALT|nr:hypothetical protein KFE25_010292 [Diacronema lutheri]
MSSSQVLPLVLAAGAAIGIGLYASAPHAQAAPKHKSITRRSSEVPRAAELAWNSNEGAAIRAKKNQEGHSGKGTH